MKVKLGKTLVLRLKRIDEIPPNKSTNTNNIGSGHPSSSSTSFPPPSVKVKPKRKKKENKPKTSSKKRIPVVKFVEEKIEKKQVRQSSPEVEVKLEETENPNADYEWTATEEEVKDLVTQQYHRSLEEYEEQQDKDCSVAWGANSAQIQKDLAQTVSETKDKLGTWPPKKIKILRKLNPNRRPRKELPESDSESENPETVIKRKSWDKRGQSHTIICPVTWMKKIESQPSMTHWTETPINFRVEDGEFLVNYPYLGEDMDPEFENELYDLYGSKDYNSTGPKMADDVFMATILKFEKKIMKRQLKSQGPDQSKPVDVVNLIRVKRKGIPMPPRSIFATMSRCFDFLGFPYELEERYAKIIKEQSKVPDLPDAPNIDSTFSEAVDREKALSTFQKLFCTRCLTYCCITHDDEDHVDAKYRNNFKKLDEMPNVDCDNADCIKKGLEVVKNKQAKKKQKAEKPVEVKWTQSEITMCGVLYGSGQNSPCYISSLLVTKSCRQVEEFIKQNLKDTKPPEEVVLPSGEADKYVPREIVEPTDVPHYRPCLHTAENMCCTADNLCGCVLGSTFCERWCSCPPDCARRFKGCKCKKKCNTSACPCYRANRECDPVLCGQCGSENKVLEDGKCQNVALLHGREKEIILKKSTVAGWGGFLDTPVKKFDLVAEYRGEVISNTESARRALYYDKIRHTYLFSLNEDLVVDATRIGSKVRFVNSSKHPNCVPKVMMVNGDHRIGIYANKHIDAGEELFFDYQDILKDENGKPLCRRKRSRKTSSTKTSTNCKTSTRGRKKKTSGLKSSKIETE